MAGLLQGAGSQDIKNTRFTPIYVNRMIRGLFLQRNPLRDASNAITDRYYGGTPDGLLDGENIELTNRLTLARRPGTTLYSNQEISDAVNSFYSFKRFSTNTETITVMADTPSVVYAVSPLTLTPVWKKTAAANRGNTSFLGVGNQLYFGNGADQTAWPGPDVLKSADITTTELTNNVATFTAANSFMAGNYVTIQGTISGGGVFNVANQPITRADSTSFDVSIVSGDVSSSADAGNASAGSVRNWGVGIAGTTGTSAYAGTGASAASGGSSSFQYITYGSTNEETGVTETFNPVPGTATDGGGGTGGAWANPNSIKNNGNYITSVYPLSLFSTSSLSSGQTTPKMQATNYGFTISATAIITGIYAVVGRDSSPALSTPRVRDSGIFLIKAGVQVGTNKANVTYDWSNNNFQVYGGSTDLWGTTWTPAEINASNFGLQVQGVASGGSITAKLASLTVIVYYTIPENPAWTNPSEVVGAPDAVYSTTLTSQGLATPNLIATNYSFSLTNTVVGVSVDVTGHVDSATGPPTLTLQLQDNNGNPLGLSKTGNFGGISDHTMVFGGADDMWGGFVNKNIANSSSFGVLISASGPGTTFSIDSVQITVYTSPKPTASPAGSGSFDATDGYQYVYAYSNGSPPYGSGAFSNATTPSDSTGTFSSKENVEVDVTASTDPQVNQIWVFRTTDGGEDGLFYALPTNPYPNTSATITDAALDSELVTTQIAATAYQNTTPPLGAIDPVYHMSRVFVHVGNTVYYSSGPDLGNIMGNGNEAFPPANNFVFPSLVIRKVPTSVGLLIFTISDVYIIYGNGSAIAALAGTSGINVFYAALFLERLGLASPFALSVQGTTIYLMSSDNQMISLEPTSGYSEIGYPIGAPNFAYPNAESLASFTPSLTYVTWHASGQDRALYVSDGINGWFRCNPNLPPDGASTGPVWSPKANIVGGCKAVQSTETTPGVWQLLIGPDSDGGSILTRNVNVFTDNNVAYPANFIMGSIVLAQPGQLAEIAFITCDYNRVGTSPVLSILLNEVSGTFESISGYVHQDPPSLYGTTLAPTTLFANRYETLQTVAGNPGQTPLGAFCRHLQIQIDFGATDATQNELLDLTIYGALYSEK